MPLAMRTDDSDQTDSRIDLKRFNDAIILPPRERNQKMTCQKKIDRIKDRRSRRIQSRLKKDQGGAEVIWSKPKVLLTKFDHG